MDIITQIYVCFQVFFCYFENRCFLLADAPPITYAAIDAGQKQGAAAVFRILQQPFLETPGKYFLLFV